jgi:nucleoside-diphosphate-sugar epimerase
LSGVEGSRVLVTGAAGFIGANLVRELVGRKARVFALVRPATAHARLAGLEDRIDILDADLEDPLAVERAVLTARPDFAIHAAAPGGHPNTPAERRWMLASTVLGTENLVTALTGTGVARFVHTGSSLEYGPREVPHVEDENPAPITPRGVAKLGSTLLCRQRAETEGFPAVTLRIFSAYGPWESPGRFVPTAVRAALSRVELLLTKPGIRRDFVYVADVVDAVLRALTAVGVEGEIVNVGRGEETTNEELVAILEEVVGRRIAVRPGAFPTRPGDVLHSRADLSKADRLLGWCPPTSLREGLARTVEWWKPASAELA